MGVPGGRAEAAGLAGRQSEYGHRGRLGNADGGVTYGDNYSVGVDVGDNIPSYSELGSRSK